jgi:hypothetical protein
VVVLRRVGYPKNDRNLRVEKLDVQFGEIVLGIENEPVRSAGEWFFNQKKWFDTPVFVGPSVTKFGPTLVGVLQVQVDSDTACGRAARDVEYVR